MKANLLLKEAILKIGIKQFVVAEKAGLTPTRLSRIIHGHVSPKKAEMASISATLGLQEEEIFKEDLMEFTPTKEA